MMTKSTSTTFLLDKGTMPFQVSQPSHYYHIISRPYQDLLSLQFSYFRHPNSNDSIDTSIMGFSYFSFLSNEYTLQRCAFRRDRTENEMKLELGGNSFLSPQRDRVLEPKHNFCLIKLLLYHIIWIQVDPGVIERARDG